MHSKRLNDGILLRFCIFVFFSKYKLCAHPYGNVTSGIDAVTSSQDYHGNETTSSIVTFSHDATGNFQSMGKTVENNSRNSFFNYLGIRNNSIGRDSTPNPPVKRDNSTTGTAKNSTSSVEVDTKSGDNSEKITNQPGPDLDQAQNPVKIKMVKSTVFPSTLRSTAGIQFEKRGNDWFPPTETTARRISSRHEDTGSEVTGEVSEVKSEPGRVTMAAKEQVEPGATTGNSLPESEPAPSTPKTLMSPVSIIGNTTWSDEGEGQVPKVATDVTTRVEFVYKSLWEDLEIGYDDEEANESEKSGKKEGERAGTRAEGEQWASRDTRLSTQTASIHRQPLDETDKMKEEDSRELARSSSNAQWKQERLSVLVPVLCGMFGAMAIVLTAYFLRNCPRNIRQLLHKTQTSDLKRRKSDLNLLIDESSGDEHP